MSARGDIRELEEYWGILSGEQRRSVMERFGFEGEPGGGGFLRHLDAAGRKEEFYEHLSRHRQEHSAPNLRPPDITWTSPEGLEQGGATVPAKDGPALRSLLAHRGRPIVVEGEPVFEAPDSQLVSEAQFYSPRFEDWRKVMGWGRGLNRKLWEYLYILHAADHYAGLGAGVRALGFGVGKEILPSILAARGCEVVCTDYVPDASQSKGWESRSLDDLVYASHCDPGLFRQRVSFRHVDMNAIPADLRGFDVLWSCGSLEHIGGIAKGAEFIARSLDCLRPGGIAVHTTEFNLSSNTATLDGDGICFFRRADIEHIAARLVREGHQVVLNFTRGTSPADQHVDKPPYNYDLSLTTLHAGFIITSIGLIIQKRAD